MKKMIAFCIPLILTFGCSKNDFSETQLNFETDKEKYFINEKIELKVVVNTRKEKETIRFYKELHNLNIFFSSLNEKRPFRQATKERLFEGSLFGDNSEYIDKYTITKEQPFERVFYGTFSESKDKIIVEIPELKISDSISKSVLMEKPKITIKGYCRTVYRTEEKKFIEKEIEILLE